MDKTIENYFNQKYLTEEEKGRLNAALKQFKKVGKGENAHKNYTHFYLSSFPNGLRQGDLLSSIRIPNWNIKTASYDKVYSKVILVSNTCDVDSSSKDRIIPKEILFAPIVELAEYEKDLVKNNKNPKEIISAIKRQEYSNLFYLPNQQSTEYIAFLDKLFWFPTDELIKLYDKIIDQRIATLDYYGFFLFIIKLTYHLCRSPEDDHRSV